MPDPVIRRAAPVEIKSLGADTDPPGTLQVIVSVFTSTDLGGDRVMPGAFAKSLAKKLPKGVWAHQWDTPIARTLAAKELLPGDPLLPAHLADVGGLYIKAQFNLDTQRGREAHSDIAFGIIDEFSIGYRVVRSERDPKSGVRQLVELHLAEWSPVLAGQHPDTSLISVKSAQGERKDTTVDTPSMQHRVQQAIERKAVARTKASPYLTIAQAKTSLLNDRPVLRRLLDEAARFDAIPPIAPPKGGQR